MTTKRPLTPDEVIEILRSMKDQEAILIGGQSLNLLAQYYLARRASLAQYQPYVSKDVDFLAHDDAAAHALADHWSGYVMKPAPWDATPTVAIAHFSLNEEEVEVDFLNHVLSVARDEQVLWRRAITITFPLDENEELDIRLLHPIDCLASRILNLEEPLERDDEQSLRQARAAMEVAISFIDEKLDEGDWREVVRSLKLLHQLILQKAVVGRHFKKHGIDLLKILRAFRDDGRIDERFREMRIAVWIRQIEQKRAARTKRLKPAD